jgi:catechol 2,3-dioxygenase-like lactoylglutathione lyase family enzyme
MIKTPAIGVAEYSISQTEPDTITAIYVSTNSITLGPPVICTGRAKGDTSNGFPGRRTITYWGPDGVVNGIFDWEIEKIGDTFQLLWRMQKGGTPYLPGNRQQRHLHHRFLLDDAADRRRDGDHIKKLSCEPSSADASKPKEAMMRVKRLNRVELLLPAERIDGAVKAFSELLGVRIDPPNLLDGHHVLTTTSWEAGIELIAPGDAQSVLHSLLDHRGKVGAIGPIVWEVENIGDIRAHVERLGISIVYDLVNENGGRQISLAAEDCFGYTVTFIERPLGPPEPQPGSGARFKRINRVELLLPAEDLDAAVALFSKLLGAEIDAPEYLPDHHVLTTTCWEAGIELFGPGDKDSVLHKLLEQKGSRGAIGPIVWEVDDISRIKQAALAQGHRLVYEFEHDDRHQICLDADTLYGYTATFTQHLR